MMQHKGPARVFDSEEDAFDAVEHGRITAGDVVVIRYEVRMAVQGCARCWA